MEPWRPKENHIESGSRVAVALNIFNPKVLYFIYWIENLAYKYVKLGFIAKFLVLELDPRIA